SGPSCSEIRPKNFPSAPSRQTERKQRTGRGRRSLDAIRTYTPKTTAEMRAGRTDGRPARGRGMGLRRRRERRGFGPVDGGAPEADRAEVRPRRRDQGPSPAEGIRLRRGDDLRLERRVGEGDREADRRRLRGCSRGREARRREVVAVERRVRHQVQAPEERREVRKE